MEKLIKAQLGLLAYRKPDESVTDLKGFKLLYRRAALVNAQRAEGSGNTSVMQTLNDWRSVLDAYFKKAAELPMPSGFEVDRVEMPKEIDPLRFADLPSFKSRDTLIAEAFNIVELDSLWELANKFDREYFDAKRKMCIGYWAGDFGYIYLQDISEAFNPKADCVSYKMSVSKVLNSELSGQAYRDARSSIVLFNFLNSELKSDRVDDVWGFLQEISEWDSDRVRYVFEDSEITVQREYTKGSKVFSPFNLDHFKPVVKLPENPNKSHMIKMLVNGQYSQFKDEYCYQPDYGPGHLETHGVDSGYGLNPLTYARKLLNGRIRVSMNANGGPSTISVTSNEWKSINLQIANRFLAEDIERDAIAGLI